MKNGVFKIKKVGVKSIVQPGDLIISIYDGKPSSTYVISSVRTFNNKLCAFGHYDYDDIKLKDNELPILYIDKYDEFINGGHIRHIRKEDI